MTEYLNEITRELSAAEEECAAYEKQTRKLYYKAVKNKGLKQEFDQWAEVHNSILFAHYLHITLARH